MTVLLLARIGTVVSSPCNRSGGQQLALDHRMQPLQHRRASPDQVRQGRHAQINAFPPSIRSLYRFSG